MKNNEIWMVTIDNIYSFDNMEKRSFLSIDKKEALKYFKEAVADYIKSELETVNNLFDKEFSSLVEIKKYIEELSKKEEPICLMTTEIEDIKYKYGIDMSKEKNDILFTISKYTKETFYYHTYPTESLEEYYIMLKKVNLGEEIADYGLPILDNVEEIEDILNNL